MIHSTEKRLIMAMDDFLKETESEIALSKTTADLLGGKKKEWYQCHLPTSIVLLYAWLGYQNCASLY